jgi:hypothetical protein
MRLLVKHGADPLFVHHAKWIAEEGFGGREHRETVTPLMAATGMLRAKAWVEPERGERERLTLEAVKLAAELGIDVNIANTDGRTALDAAKTLKYGAVVEFLVAKGAKSGQPAQKEAAAQ